MDLLCFQSYFFVVGVVLVVQLVKKGNRGSSDVNLDWFLFQDYWDVVMLDNFLDLFLVLVFFFLKRVRFSFGYFLFEDEDLEEKLRRYDQYIIVVLIKIIE